VQEKGQRPGLASRVTVRACWGGRLREGVAARSDARANANAMRTRWHGAVVTKTGWLPTARGLGLADDARPLVKAAGVPPRLEGRGVHKREETGVLTLVASGRSGARR
jgi:hypothetical protein